MCYIKLIYLFFKKGHTTLQTKLTNLNIVIHTLWIQHFTIAETTTSESSRKSVQQKQIQSTATHRNIHGNEKARC